MGGKTTATKSVSQQVSYNVKLFIAAKRTGRRRHMYDIEKLDPSTGKYKPVKVSEDLLNTSLGDLRLIIEDNTGRGYLGKGPGELSKEDFYVKNGLVDVLNVFVPLRIEVRKFKGQSTAPARMRSNEVEAVFEIIDPPEDTGNIRGPGHVSSSRTGKEFIEEFIRAMKTEVGVNDDNCIRGFAAPPFHSRCRRSGDKVAASDVLYNRRRQPLPADPSNGKRARVRIRRRKQKKGTAKVFFHPPPILGDNYKIKVTINNMKGQVMLLRNKTAGDCTHFETPTITVWKRVKMHMVVCQEGLDYGEIKWDKVRNAYRDAFIDVKEPPRKRRFEISMEEWMKYLDKFVYGEGNKYGRNWMRNTWEFYKSTYNVDDHKADFDNFSFPQDKIYEYEIQKGDNLSKIARKCDMTWRELYEYKDKNGKSNRERLNEQKRAKRRPQKSIDNPDLIYPRDVILVPVRLTPPDGDDDHEFSLAGVTASHLLNLLFHGIVRKKLKKPFTWSQFRNPSKGRRIGLCVLFCKPPSREYPEGGFHPGGKLLVVFSVSDVTHRLTHEMGHVLFLNHGVTRVIRATRNPDARPPQPDASVVVRDMHGPYWDEHYSEDMVACVMSYFNEYYDSDGNVHADTDHPFHLKRADHPTDWHFCGVCLLQLRNYDVERMLHAGNDSFRLLQYTYRKPIIAVAGDPVKMSDGTVLENISFPDSLTIEAGTSDKRLYFLCPPEGVMDNRGRDPYKDICQLTNEDVVGGLPRARWRSKTIGGPRSGRDVADVRVLALGGDWGSWLEAKTPGQTEITFEIRYGRSAKDVIESDPLTVKVVPSKKTKEELEKELDELLRPPP